MEVLLMPSIPSKPQLFSSVSIISPTPSLTTLHKKTLYRLHKTHLKKPFPNPLFATNSQLPTCKTLRITARLGRPTNRRNYLRRKFTHDLQVRQIPHKITDPVSHSVDNEPSDSNLVNTGLEHGSENKKSTNEIDSESVLWNKLESWAEQYKNDFEFWGVGSNPIFTVFEHVNGSFERVVVDEDEILRRSGVDPLYFKKVRDLEGFEEVNSKISHAKFLAKEMEFRRHVLPKTSSVVKYVVSGESDGWVSRIRSVSVPPNLVPNVSKIGFAMVCGFLFVWVVKKVFSLGGNGKEVTRLEKEMLRRKIKSRMDKETLQKGSVEVVEMPSETATVVTERPQLDKEELLDNIRKAKNVNNKRGELDGSCSRDVGGVEMDARIREIQRMARHAREIERGESSPNKGGEPDEQTSNELPVIEKGAAEEPSDSVKMDEFQIHASDELPSTDIDTVEKQAEGDLNQKSNYPNEFFTEPSLVNGSMKVEFLGNQEPENIDTAVTSEKVTEADEISESQSESSGAIIDDSKSFTNTSLGSHDSSNLSDSTAEAKTFDVSSRHERVAKEMPVRRQPKIIRSVREAREYLSRKHDRRAQGSDVSATASGRIEIDMSKQLAEDGRASESLGVDKMLDPVLAANFGEDYGVKGNESVAADGNQLNKEAQIRSKHNRPSDPEYSSIDDMSKQSISSETSDSIPHGDAFHDSRMEEKHLPNERSVDELPDPVNLSEISDLVPDRHTSSDVDISCEGSKILGETSVHGANSDSKEYWPAEMNPENASQINGIPQPIGQSETSVSSPVADGLHSSGNEENTFRPFEINDDVDITAETSQSSENCGQNIVGGSSGGKEKWLEKNFHEMEPIVKKIGTGFRDNYNVAREKVKQEGDMGLDFLKLRSLKDDTEYEWMQDDKLREIVFRVRDNELAGRDPFHSMDPEEKLAFFEGLESKVEKENQKLSNLHEWLHSNIENIDYGADGISIYDPPEKVLPRWKGPPVDKIPEFLTNPVEQQELASFLKKADESPQQDMVKMSQEASTTKSRSDKVAKISKTVIETSDGSIKPGKKSGKEYWKHTKKWSRGFVESYNAETDPEVKSVMKDIGKDLDRWITEEEVQKAADLMDKIPQRGKEYIEKKLNKLKREMEMFGPAAVVSKYSEYAEQKEEDYLWWLDLHYVLCIEMYTYEGEEQKVGFYSLEMAADLELEPKPHHVIAFEDPSDCKNFCYIIQAHLEMLGSGKAFVVAQPPKDVYRQAKANGFSVTCIRKGELQLNVDQPLEEVEELITEIGSKVYHDMIMRERSVDVSSLMKGVFGISKPSKRRRKKRALKKPSKP